MKDLIGKYLNRYGYTDVNPVGKIIAVSGKSTLIVQKIYATENTTEMIFHSGGFSAHCENNSSQKWEFIELEDTIKIRLSKSLLKTHKIEDEPGKFYDYNF